MVNFSSRELNCVIISIDLVVQIQSSIYKICCELRHHIINSIAQSIQLIEHNGMVKNKG